jgi:hypothetical protein
LARVPAVPSLIEIQLDVLLARDAQGRLTTTRDPERRPAPRLFLGRSRDGNVWAVRADVDRATQAELDLLFAAEPTLAAPSAVRAPTCRERARELLAPVEGEWRGPAYVLPDGLLHDGRAREVTAESSGEWLEQRGVARRVPLVGGPARRVCARRHRVRRRRARCCLSLAARPHGPRGGGRRRNARALPGSWARHRGRGLLGACGPAQWSARGAQLYAEDWHLT